VAKAKTASKKSGNIFIGIGGWTFEPWRGVFYPEKLTQAKELSYAASKLTSIEINGTYYGSQKPESFRKWASEVPDGFVFSVKGPRYVSHLRRLKDVDVPLANFFASGVLALGPALGPVLWQLPESLRLDADVLDAFLAALPRTTTAAAELSRRHDEKVPEDRALTSAEEERPLRYALEFRSPTFATAAATALLRRHDVATVLADTAGRWPRVDQDTGPVRYVRLHGDQELYASGYTDRALDEWAERCRAWADAGQDVFVYFDNDMKGYAPRDAIALIARLG